MNTTMQKMILAGLLIWMSGLNWILAQDQAAPRFVGSSLKDVDAVRTADFIVVGQFKSSGDANLDSLGEDYDNAVIDISFALKGTIAGEIRALTV